jgi:hypothetical protein
MRRYLGTNEHAWHLGGLVEEDWQQGLLWRFCTKDATIAAPFTFACLGRLGPCKSLKNSENLTKTPKTHRTIQFIQSNNLIFKP